MEGARAACEADIAAMEAIAERRRAEIGDERGGPLFLRREAGPPELGDRLRSALDSDDAIVVVGTYDSVVFGYGLAAIEPLIGGGLLARLEHLVVDREARKSGIGEAMMNLLLERAAAAGCVGLDSVALPGDRDTKNFFESFGLKARLLTVHRSLQSSGAPPTADGGS